MATIQCCKCGKEYQFEDKNPFCPYCGTHNAQDYSQTHTDAHSDGSYNWSESVLVLTSVICGILVVIAGFMSAPMYNDAGFFVILIFILGALFLSAVAILTANISRNIRTAKSLQQRQCELSAELLRAIQDKE